MRTSNQWFGSAFRQQGMIMLGSTPERMKHLSPQEEAPRRALELTREPPDARSAVHFVIFLMSDRIVDIDLVK